MPGYCGDRLLCIYFLVTLIKESKICLLQFNRRVEEHDGQQNEDVETEEEMVQGDEVCESEDTNEESGDETADIVCEPDQDEAKEEHTSDEDKPEDGLDLDTIPEGEGAESDRDDQDEDFSGKKYKNSLKTERTCEYEVTINEKSD